MYKLGVEKWLFLAVISMYTAAITVVRTVYSNSNCFEVKVSMHQGSALSFLLLVIVMEALSSEFRVTLPWELWYMDDLALISETEVLAITTRSSAYNNSHGKVTLNSQDKASMTITNSKGLNAESWMT